MRNIKRVMKNMKYNITFGIALICAMLFISCNDISDMPEIHTPINSNYGKISISFVGEEVSPKMARTVLPSTVFDKYVYTFTRAGETTGTEINPGGDGLFCLEVGSYTVSVQAYIGVEEPYTLVASGVSSSFSVGYGDNDPVEVSLSVVDIVEEGKFSYTITYPADALAEITLQKWPELNDIILTPVDIAGGNGKTQTFQLEAGSYLLKILVGKNDLYAGVIETVHISPSLSTVYTKDFVNKDFLASTPITSVEIIVTAPVKGAVPETTASGTGNFSIGPVSWSPEDNLFFGSTTYTATLTLTANSHYTFTGLGFASINGEIAAITNNTGTEVTLSYSFLTEEKSATDIVIKTQPTNLTYTHGDQLDLTGLVVTLIYDDSSTEDVASAAFIENHITAIPAHDDYLVYSVHNDQPVTITFDNLELLTTDNLIVDPIILTVDPIPAQIYTGDPILPTVTVNDGAMTLSLTTDYTVEYADNTEAGTATVTITGVGNYAGSSVNVEFIIKPLIHVTFNSVTADGSLTQVTTALTLIFNQAITALTADDITLSGVSGVTKGTLSEPSGIGSVTYILPISGHASDSTLTVSVFKSGYTISGLPKTVDIYAIPVTFNTVTADGSLTQTTTTLTLSFDQAIIDLTADDIILDDVSGVTKGTLSEPSGIGPVTYTLPISGHISDGTLTVSVSKLGYTISDSPKVVDIYAIPVTLSSVTANGSTTQTTTTLTLTFDQAITGLTVNDITLSGVSGVTKGTLSGPSGTGTVTYTLGISGFNSGGTLTVSVSKSCYTISDQTQTVSIYYYAIPITFSSVTANGGITGGNTTALTLTFTQAISGLSADDITLSGVSGVTKGTLSGPSGTGPVTYTLGISGFTSGGNISVSASKSGYDISGSYKMVTILYHTTVTVTLVNNTNYILNAFWIKPSSSTDWGDQDTFIEGSGGSREVTLSSSGGNYDIMWRTSPYAVGLTYIKYNVSLTNGRTIIFTESDYVE